MSVYYNEFDKNAAAWLRELIKEGHIADGVVDERSITEVKAHELTGYTQHHFFAGIGGWSLALRLAGIGDDEEWCTASCPCQPFSAAGKQMGNDDPRHLFPALRKLIARFNPARVVGEQVASKSGREWLSRVRLEMAALGYGVGAADLCSAGVGSPNIRQRLYWMAYANGGNPGAKRIQRGGQHGQLAQDGGAGGLGNAMRSRSLSGSHAGIYCGEESAGSRDGELERSGSACGLANASSARSTAGLSEPPQRQEGNTDQPIDGSRGSGFWSAFDLLYCTDGKARRIEPGSFPLAHGISGRVGLLRGYGNAINPHVAAAFLKACEEDNRGAVVTEDWS